MRVIVLVVFLVTFSGNGISQATVDGGSWGNDQDSREGVRTEADVVDDAVTVTGTVTTPATPGTDGTTAEGAPAPAPTDEHWVSWWAVDHDAEPPCLHEVAGTVVADSREDAETIADQRTQMTNEEAEGMLQAGLLPLLCPAPDPVPGTPAIPGETLEDSISQVLPTAQPSISGGSAITGLRSWLDLGRPSQLTTSHQLVVGDRTFDVTVVAAATATVDWGDGSVTTHTSRGGGYHDGEPGPDDIVHTYTHTADDNTLTVTDTWDIRVTFPGVGAVDLTWTAAGSSITFDIDEVRSARDR